MQLDGLPGRKGQLDRESVSAVFLDEVVGFPPVERVGGIAGPVDPVGEPPEAVVSEDFVFKEVHRKNGDRAEIVLRPVQMPPLTDAPWTRA